MIQISVQVSSGVTSFTLCVRAESIQRAIALVEKSFSGAEEIGVIFPIPPEPFFVKNIALESVVWREASEEIAG